MQGMGTEAICNTNTGTGTGKRGRLATCATRELTATVLAVSFVLALISWFGSPVASFPRPLRSE